MKPTLILLLLLFTSCQHYELNKFHLQQQLKEAKELITQIDFHLNYYGQIDEDTQIQINQFLTHNK